MTKIFIAIAFACILSLFARAKNDAGIEGVAFGSNYETTLAGIRSTFGTPIQANKQQIVYKDMTFKGLKFEKAIFKFQTDSLGNTYFSEARFTSSPTNKRSALKDIEVLAKTMDKDYPGVTIDWEDESTPFYKGGMSPLGNSYLFTVCIYPVNNGYTTVLRYGPLPYVKR